jgi:hypothetical protein
LTLQSRVIRQASQSQSTAQPSGRRLLATYRNLRASMIDLERELVDMGLLKPEERSVFSREERRAAPGDANGRDGV